MPAIRGYRVLRLLGEGGMGRVYLAEDEVLERRVAIKMVTAGRAGDAASRQRFLREARAMATVEHPNVVRVYAFGETHGQAYFVMEYVDGVTLGQRLERQPRTAIDAALGIGRDAAQALAAAWKRGIVHRDVKPSNILLDADDRAKVGDFGLARAVGEADANMTGAGAVVGTAHYMSPEQALGKDLDFRSDVYSLGIVLYEMLAGRRPFQGSPSEIIAAQIRDPLPSIRVHRDDVPEGLVDVVDWMTRKDPAARPASYSLLLSGLARGSVPSDARSEAATLTSSPSRGTGSGAVRRRPRLAATLAGLCVAAAGMVGYQHLRHRHPPGTFVVAVAPLYGLDAESAHEGRVVGALVENELSRRLAPEEAIIVGLDETRTAVHAPQAARALGSRLGATVVVWGQVLALRGQVEIETRVTEVAGASGVEEADEGAPSTYDADAPNPIELRRARAASVFGGVALLAARHTLSAGRADAALRILDHTPNSAEAYRCRADALRRLGRDAEARGADERAAQLTPRTGAR